MPDYADELEQIVAELNRAANPDNSPKPRTTNSAPGCTRSGSLDQLLALAVRRAASDLLLIAGAPVTLRIAGRFAAAGPAARRPKTPAICCFRCLRRRRPGAAAQQVRGSVFQPRRHRPFSRQHASPARHAGRQHPAAARKNPDARIAAFARDAAPARGSAARIDSGHRAHRLRQKLHAGRADRFDQHAIGTIMW